LGERRCHHDCLEASVKQFRVICGIVVLAPLLGDIKYSHTHPSLSDWPVPTQPGLVSPGGSEQAQRYQPASLSSDSGESLRHIDTLSSRPVSMVMRSPYAGDDLDPPLWKIPNKALSLSLSPSLSLRVGGCQKALSPRAGHFLQDSISVSWFRRTFGLWRGDLPSDVIIRRAPRRIQEDDRRLARRSFHQGSRRPWSHDNAIFWHVCVFITAFPGSSRLRIEPNFENSRVAGASPNHQPIGASADPNLQR
jgi:hypothetical protein